MNRLLEIGFQRCGYWCIENDLITFVLNQHQNSNNILYAFVCDGEVKYVGKTTQILSKRMAGYKRPGATQSTNIRNNKLIKEYLESNVAVDILALPDNGLMHYGQFHMNLAAALEDNIISVMSPEWNGGRKEIQEVLSNETLSDNAEDYKISKEDIKYSFVLELQPTYYRSGFFNVKVSDEKLIGSDGESIEIYTGDSNQPIQGSINRRCNTNSTPRIMGGIGLRNWFVKSANVGVQLTISVMSPNSIRIENIIGTKSVA